jgi:hypothetical protein
MTKTPMFIDFEGNMNGEQFLLGVGYNGEITQTILNDRLKPLLQHPPYNLNFTPPRDACEELLAQARQNSVPLAGFTTHDLQVIETLVGHKIDVEYINMHRDVKKWINKFHYRSYRASGNRPEWTLEAISEWMELTVPSDYARGKTTKRINDVMQGLVVKEGVYNVLTPVQKAKATKLIKHNKFDVEAIIYIYNKINC